MELAILNFRSKSTVRLNTSIDKTIEKCNDFYKKMYTNHNKFQALVATQVLDFPEKDQHLKNLQDKLQTDEEIIQKIENIGEEAI